MALDIAKHGRKPYQKLEQPEARDASGVHIRRYFSSFFGRLLGALLSGGAFAVLAWGWDFGGSAGYGRSIIWIAVSGAIAVVLLLGLLFRGGQSGWSAYGAPHRLAVGLAFAFVVLAGIGAVANLGIAGALGLLDGTEGPALSFLGAALGAVWLIAICFGRGTPSAAKQVLLAWFIGSSVLALAAAFALVAGGYQAAMWIPEQGVLLAMSATVFLMLAFAMFQKGAIKFLWSASICLHVFVLFAWDSSGPWLVLLAGASSLLIFQMRYSKKLWQRNFIYPLQVFAIAALLLIIPVKMFTGSSVPQGYALARGAVVEAVSDKGIIWFGAGFGAAEEYALVSGVSFQDYGALDAPAPPAIGSGYLQLYLASGIVGVLGWAGFALVMLFAGITWWRTHAAAFKEGTMSESEYLGAITLVAFVMLVAGFWFSAFSFLNYWMAMILSGCALAFWRQQPAEKAPPALSARRAHGRALVVAAVLFVVAYAALLTVHMRALSASASASSTAFDQKDTAEQAQEWQRISDRAPWSAEYRFREAKALIAALATPISIDAQRAAIESATAILVSETRDSRDPIAHWRAAELYRALEAHAEGSAAIAWQRYRTASELWPGNAALSVVISEFYREASDALVNQDQSAADLRSQARQGLERSLYATPQYLPGRLELAFLRENEEGVASALAELEPWEDASPEITYHVGRLYFNDGNFEQAAEKFQDVMNAIPGHSNAHYSLGIAYYRLERYEESLEQFEAVLALNPESADVQEKINQVKDKL